MSKTQEFLFEICIYYIIIYNALYINMGRLYSDRKQSAKTEFRSIEVHGKKRVW